MIAHTLRGPHNLYRRYQGFVERTLTAAGLALLVTMTLNALPVYPENWVLVTGVAIALLGIRWPLLAYIITIAVMIYPVYTINLYLAVLFVAVSVLGHRLFVHYTGATVLVLATPFLAQYHLHWLIPILGGLWWGGASGAWVGGLAAVWGKFVGGVAGLDIDWLLIAGQAPDSQVIIARFQAANSLETLILLVEPFAASATIMLYNLLQVVGWAAAGGFVGSLAARKWVRYRAPWSTLVVTTGGGLIMIVTHLGLPHWLNEAMTPATTAILRDPAGPLFSLLMIIFVGTTIHSLRESLDLPVAPSKRFQKKDKDKARKRKLNPAALFQRNRVVGQQSIGHEEPVQSSDFDRTRRPIRIPHHSELPEWEPPNEESGLIMLEID